MILVVAPLARPLAHSFFVQKNFFLLSLTLQSYLQETQLSVVGKTNFNGKTKMKTLYQGNATYSTAPILFIQQTYR